jgi:hypothetical protein
MCMDRETPSRHLVKISPPPSLPSRSKVTPQDPRKHPVAPYEEEAEDSEWTAQHCRTKSER